MIDVIRDYIGARYHIATHEQTTADLVRSLERAAPEQERVIVVAWFDAADLVRYGGLRAHRRASAAPPRPSRATLVASERSSKEAA